MLNNLTCAIVADFYKYLEIDSNSDLPSDGGLLYVIGIYFGVSSCIFTLWSIVSFVVIPILSKLNNILCKILFREENTLKKTSDPVREHTFFHYYDDDTNTIFESDTELIEYPNKISHQYVRMSRNHAPNYVDLEYSEDSNSGSVSDSDYNDSDVDSKIESDVDSHSESAHEHEPDIGITI